MYRREKVKNYEEYEVDTNGVVYSKRGEPLKPSTNNRGYRMVVFSINGKTRTFGVHRLVARQFVINDDETRKTQVNHIDGNKANNSVDNLEWVTPKENMKHSVEVLGNGKEEKNGNARGVIGLDINSNTVKYRFSSLIGAARFFDADERRARGIQIAIWNVLSKTDGHKTYRGCVWIYEDEYASICSERSISDYIAERVGRKFSGDDIRWIRSNYISGDKEFGARPLGRKFHVEAHNILDIVNYKTYKDIT